MHNLYTPNPVWHDPFNSFENWTTTGNWQLDTDYYNSPPSSAFGIIDTSKDPAVTNFNLSLKYPIDISSLSNPYIIYQTDQLGSDFKLKLQLSNDGISYENVEMNKNQDESPFNQKECKVLADMSGGVLYLKCVVNGTDSKLHIDDIMVSDGIGELTDINWNYYTEIQWLVRWLVEQQQS